MTTDQATSSADRHVTTKAALSLGALGVVFGDIGTSPMSQRLNVERNPPSVRWARRIRYGCLMPAEDRQRFSTPGELLKSRRIAHGLSQERLALRGGTTQAAISRIERDQLSPSFRTLDGLLAVLGEDVELTAQRTQADWDPTHLNHVLARSPAERLELAMSWNRLAGEIALAGEAARRDSRPTRRDSE